MDWPTLGFWLMLYGGIPCVLAMHLHRKGTKTNQMATPITILVLAGIAGTASMIGTNSVGGPLETAEAILHLAIPTGIYLLGACLAIFGGPSPVGPIPKNWRRGGGAFMLISITWIIVLSLKPDSIPIKSAILHDIAVSSLLVGITLIATVGTVVVISIGEKRWIAAISTLSLCIGSMSLLYILSNSFENIIDPSRFSETIGESLKTAIGTGLGLCISLWVAFHVAVVVEKNSILPETAQPVTEKESKIVMKHLKENLGGEQE